MMNPLQHPEATTGIVNRPTADISVVVGSNPRMVFDCLASFSADAPPDVAFRYFVTCNWLDRAVADSLRVQFGGLDLVVIENPEPRGFAANHDAILERSQADFVFILNDDLVFRPGAVGKLLEFMNAPENRSIGAVSPKLLNSDGSLQPSTYAFPTVATAVLSLSGLRGAVPFAAVTSRVAAVLGLGMGRSRFWAHDCTVDVDSFRGACMLCRMDAVRQAGLMSTLSLAGGEEIEWHMRFWKHGWRVVYFPDAEVVHYWRQTTGKSDGYRNERLKSLLYFFRQHRAKRQFYIFGALAWLALALRWLWCSLRRQRDQAAVESEGCRIIRKWLTGHCES